MRIASNIIAIVLLFATFGCNPDELTVHAPKIYFSDNGEYEIGPTDTITLSPRILYDDNTTYEWRMDGEVISTELEYEFAPKTMKDYTFTFSVINDIGADTCNVQVSVLKHVTCASFTNFTKPRKASLVLMPDTLTDFRVDTTLTFSNAINADTTTWYGFAFSSIVSVNTASITSASIGIAYVNNTQSSAEYMALNCNNSDCMPIVTFNKAYTVKSIDVTNDNFALMVSRYGATIAVTDSTGYIINYMNTGDYLRLCANGLDEYGDIVGTVSYNLVDCLTENTSHFTRVTDWTTVDLTSLGKVHGIYFTMECSRLIFPLYACIDNIKLQD